MRSLALLAALFCLAPAGCVGEKTTALQTVKPLVVPTPHLGGAVNSKAVPALRDFAVVARLSIDSNVERGAVRPPLNVSLCIDTSGSMDGKAIDDARKAARAFVDGLRPGDGFSIVTFDRHAQVLVPATTLAGANDLVAIRAKIDKMTAQGTTAMTEGFASALEQVRHLYDPGRVNRIVLVGDGVPNDATPLRAMVQQAATSGISVSTMGLGLDYDELLMGDLAQLGGGRFKFIEDSTKLASVFEQELTRINSVSARNATIEIVPGPGVTIDGVIGLQVAHAANSTSVFVGDVSLGTHRDIFVKMHVHGRRDGSTVELADATMRFVASDGQPHEEHVFLSTHASSDDAVVAREVDADVDHAAKQAQQAADAIEAIRKARETDKPTPANGKQAKLPSPQPAPSADIKQQHDVAMRTLMGD